MAGDVIARQLSTERTGQYAVQARQDLKGRELVGDMLFWMMTDKRAAMAV